MQVRSWSFSSKRDDATWWNSYSKSYGGIFKKYVPLLEISHVRYTLLSEHQHLPLPLPDVLFSWIFTWHTPSLPWSFCWNAYISEGLSHSYRIIALLFFITLLYLLSTLYISYFVIVHYCLLSAYSTVLHLAVTW